MVFWGVLPTLDKEFFFCFLKIVLVKNICLCLWERYGRELPIELAEIFESESENGFFMVLTSSLTEYLYVM